MAESGQFEVYAQPQGEIAEVFPEIVVSVEDDQFSASRRAWALQMETCVSICLYGARPIAQKESSRD